MKEYIPLEWFEDFLVGENLAWDGRKIPTVSKADICREFAEKIKDTLYYCDDLQKEYGITSESGFKILDLIDRILAEMEREE